MLTTILSIYKQNFGAGMKSLDKLAELADRFEHKLSKYGQTAPVVSQEGTTELFFDNEANQRSFHAAINKEGGAVYKVLLGAFNKTNALVSFNLKMDATANKGATWILDVTPPALKNAVAAALNAEFQKLMGQSMAARLKSADSKAKNGSGSGTLDVGGLELAP